MGYKIMENSETAKIIEHEKRKLHMKYIIALAAIFCFGSIVLALYNQEAFVGQVSFGCTITSIVLSVIAIWMSISGERSTNDIRIKISESTERLARTTQEIETLNNSYKENMNTQLTELKDVQEQLSKILYTVDDMKKQIFTINSKSITDFNTVDNNTMDTEQRISLFHNIYNWITYGKYFREFVFCKMTKEIIYKYTTNTKFSLEEIWNHLELDQIFVDADTINVYWGVINTLLAASVFDDENAVNSISKTIDKILYPQHTSP